jgi:hypothetical protein
MLHNMHVSSISVSYVYFAKVDLDVAYVAMAIYACFKRVFQHASYNPGD